MFCLKSGISLVLTIKTCFVLSFTCGNAGAQSSLSISCTTFLIYYGTWLRSGSQECIIIALSWAHRHLPNVVGSKADLRA